MNTNKYNYIVINSIRNKARSLSPTRKKSNFNKPISNNNNIESLKQSLKQSLSPVREYNEIFSQKKTSSLSPVINKKKSQNMFRLLSSVSSSSLNSNESFTFSPTTSSICLSQLDIELESNIIENLTMVVNKLKSNDGKYFKKCKYCYSKFLTSKENNMYCSYRCNKLEHYDDNIKIFNIKCKKCKNMFETKNIFTDYCSDKCFKLI